MTTIIIRTPKDSDARKIVSFLKDMKTISEIRINKSDTKLKISDFSISGRSATDEELDELTVAMEASPKQSVNLALKKVKKHFGG